MAVLAHEGTYPIMYGSWPIPVGSAHRAGYIARPDESGRFPVVVVLPGLSGMGSLEKDLCRKLARKGMAAVTLDLYRTGADSSYSERSDSRVLTDLDEVHEFVLSDDVDWNLSDYVGLLGLDVGGRFALIAGATRDWVRSVAVCSTPLTGDEEREHQVESYLNHLPIPVLGLYGADDHLIDAGSVDEAQRRNESGQWLLYESVGHGFFDITSDGFDQAAADDALARMAAFFEATLGKAVIEELG